jgi:hypothetical protein
MMKAFSRTIVKFLTLLPIESEVATVGFLFFSMRGHLSPLNIDLFILACSIGTWPSLGNGSVYLHFPSLLLQNPSISGCFELSGVS